MGVEAGKQTEELFICHRVSFATLNHVIKKVQACPYAPALSAKWEGHDAHARFYWLQFGNNSNTVADNRVVGGGSGEQRGEAVQSSRISATVVSKQDVMHQSATSDDVSAAVVFS